MKCPRQVGALLHHHRATMLTLWEYFVLLCVVTMHTALTECIKLCTSAFCIGFHSKPSVCALPSPRVCPSQTRFEPAACCMLVLRCQLTAALAMLPCCARATVIVGQVVVQYWPCSSPKVLAISADLSCNK